MGTNDSPDGTDGLLEKFSLAHLLVALILVVGFSSFLYVSYSYSINTIQALDIYVSTALSLILISVYVGMLNANKRQTDIMEYQRIIQESQHEPDFRAKSPKVVERKLRYDVWNRGPGLGINGRLRIHLREDNVSRGEPETIVLRPMWEGQSESDMYPGTLRPNQREEWFFEIPHSQITEYMESNEFEKAKCEYEVVVQGVDGEEEVGIFFSTKYDTTMHSSPADIFK
ncbi:hypothetical protein [Haloferax larsenii]|uniref:Uncharacterized protein n=1 Tax=Haloferax larsenii TaxID=302484 RepID=A0A1H7KWF8_HALLR|nr:hypothetical protein [Haloferax larsenii]SEK90840.1 hypothetical protein SAMN04488691_102130 [Haloferax larsenii]